jgi:glutamate--cysteine ligase
MDVMRRLVEPLFQPRSTSQPDGSMGAELELIPIRDESQRRVLIDADEYGPGTADIVRDASRDRNWREIVDSYGAPSWLTGDGGRICYEPGGQLEICSPVFGTPELLGDFLRSIVGALRESAKALGVSLLTTGVDPYNAVADVPLQLHAPRYEAMTRYFDAIGAAGVRMMRQTASLQISVELGPDPMSRWTLLNSLAPYLVAAYASSPRYERQATGFQSYRSHLWQTLDRTRTGVPYDEKDPVDAYARFAENAGRIVDDDATHISTLFPEIRPRGYFEIRSIDSMEPDRAAHAIQFVSDLVHDPLVAAEASRLLGAPDPTLLERAARLGRSDELIGKKLDALEQLATRSSGA